MKAQGSAHTHKLLVFWGYSRSCFESMLSHLSNRTNDLPSLDPVSRLQTCWDILQFSHSNVKPCDQSWSDFASLLQISSPKGKEHTSHGQKADRFSPGKGNQDVRYMCRRCSGVFRPAMQSGRHLVSHYISYLLPRRPRSHWLFRAFWSTKPKAEFRRWALCHCTHFK